MDFHDYPPLLVSVSFYQIEKARQTARMRGAEMEMMPENNRNLLKLVAPAYSMLQDEVTAAMFAVQPIGESLQMRSLSVAEVNMYRDMSAEWWYEVRREHLFSLTSPEACTRACALQNVIHFACFYGDRVDLEPITLILLAIYHGDTNRKNRLLALAALDLIGSESAMRSLLSTAGRQEDPLIRRLTRSVLSGYFEENTAN